MKKSQSQYTEDITATTKWRKQQILLDNYYSNKYNVKNTNKIVKLESNNSNNIKMTTSQMLGDLQTQYPIAKSGLLLTHQSTPTSALCELCGSISTPPTVLCSGPTGVIITRAARGLRHLNVIICRFGEFAETTDASVLGRTVLRFQRGSYALTSWTKLSHWWVGQYKKRCSNPQNITFLNSSGDPKVF